MLFKFVKLAGITLAVAFIVSMAASYLLQTSNADSVISKELSTLLDDVESLIEDNENTLQKIRQEIDKEYLEKTRAFAEMIRLSPDILDNYDELCKIRDELGVDELHVCDENGVLWWGTVKEYYGFDFATGEQTKPFLAALTNPNFELAQDPQPNGATGMYFQYISIARYDRTGIVQIGMRPERLEEALSKASPSNMLDSMKLNKNTRILISENINDNDKIITGDSQKTLEGKNLTDLLGNVYEGQSFASLDGNPVFWSSRVINGNLITAIVTQEYIYNARNQSLIIVAITNLVIFTILLLIIALLVSRQFAKPLESVTGSLVKIGSGDFDIQIEVYTSKEFKNLSDGINGMVKNIKKMLQRSDNMNGMIKGVVKEIENNVNVVGTAVTELFGESNDLSGSADIQNAAAGDISRLLEEVNELTGKNAERASCAKDVSTDALRNAGDGRDKMEEMLEAVQEIDKASQNISKVIKTIDDIAFQTNILALNAAVEAARAGEAGKGFAIVADEVRNLASKSADAAKQTESLIKSSIQKANYGVMTAQETSEIILEVVGKINKSASLIEEIADSTQEQAATVEQLSEKMDTIVQSIETTALSASRITNESERLRLNADEMGELMQKLTSIED